MNNTHVYDIITVGAGLGGVTLARELNHKSILLIDKAKSVRGRAATRRLGEHPVNHGLNGFIVTHPKLRSLVEIGLEHNLLKMKDSKVFGVTSINSWLKHLAKDLKVKNQTRITYFKKNSNIIEVFDSSGSIIANCRNLVMTAPAPQAHTLLEASGFEASFLKEVKYSTLVRHYLLMKNEINYSHLNLHEVIDDFLLNLLKIEASQIIDSYTHRWLYSEVETPISSEYQNHYSNQGVHLLGDYFNLTGVNGLMKLVERLISSIDHKSITD
jgi:predicted NAD/FAD-dependent oxidoreductase